MLLGAATRIWLEGALCHENSKICEARLRLVRLIGLEIRGKQGGNSTDVDSRWSNPPIGPSRTLKLWITTCYFLKWGLLCGFSTGIRRNRSDLEAKPLL
jgi:hypothetical protein